jgi:hypothetical protein
VRFKDYCEVHEDAQAHNNNNNNLGSCHELVGVPRVAAHLLDIPLALQIALRTVYFVIAVYLWELYVVHNGELPAARSKVSVFPLGSRGRQNGCCSLTRRGLPAETS